jgi:hypothetical protein
VINLVRTLAILDHVDSMVQLTLAVAMFDIEMMQVSIG